MADTIRLEVVTPRGLAVRAEVDEVQGPGKLGEFGVLPGHLPLLVALRAGVLRFRSQGKMSVFAVGPGFAEAGPDRMSVLTDLAIGAAEVDIAAVKSERDDIDKKVETFDGERTGPEYDAILRQRDWLGAQLDAAKETNRAV